MSITLTNPGVAWTAGRRLLMGVCAIALFFGVASLIKPSPRGAFAATDDIFAEGVDGYSLRATYGTPQRAAADGPKAAKITATTNAKGWKLIGTLEGRDHVLRCWATGNGPRYSVYSLDGHLIQDDLPADEVYRGFPDLNMPGLRADPPTQSGEPVGIVDSWRD